MTFIKLYNFIPQNGEYVNFKFIEYRENYLMCKLTDYDKECIMTFQCLTNKKRIKSLKSLAPLNKDFIGLIENIDNENIELNLVNINKNSTEYDNFVENNKKNHMLKKFINQYIHKYNKNKDNILQEYIYKLEKNKNYLDQILENNEENDFYEFIRKNFNSNSNKLNELKLKISCYGDINNVIKLFDETINELNIKDIEITQPKVSEYVISSDNKLDDFIFLVKNNVIKYPDINIF